MYRKKGVRRCSTGSQQKRDKNRNFWMISDDLERIVYKQAWSIESMPGHGAEGRQVEYLGSRVCDYIRSDTQSGWRIIDYYRDSIGDYWYGNRVMLESGEFVTMTQFLMKNGSNHAGKAMA